MTFGNLIPIESAENRQYVIIRIGGSAPTIAHKSRQKAADEAKRLCLQHPGHKFLVCQIIQWSKKQPTTLITLNITDEELKCLPLSLIEQLSPIIRERYFTLNNP